MSIFEKDTIKDEKIENIIESLLRELDKVDQWNDGGYRRVSHKHYDLDVDREDINRPHTIKIPRKWRRTIAKKIRLIHRHNELERMDFTQAILDHQYPIQIKRPTDEAVAWCKENEVEYKITDGNYAWLYIKEGDGAMAFKLRWS